MKFHITLAIFCATLLGAGCTTTRIENSNSPEITIDKFGAVTFYGKRIAPEDIAEKVADAGIPKKTQIRIAVPTKPDRELMSRIAGTLAVAGYPTLFITEKRATANLANPSR